MKNKFPATVFSMFVFFILFLYLLTGCSTLLPNPAIAPISEDQSSGNAILPQMPDFLVFVNPKNSITIDKYQESLKANCYPCGITIGIRWDRTKLSLNGTGFNALLSRISLSVDEQKQSNLAIVAVSDGLMPFGPFYFSWAPNLLPGLHEATLRFTTSSEGVAIYTWRFVVTEK